MKTARSFVTAWVTVPGRPLAVKRSRLSVESGLSACALISGPVEVIDRWQGVVESRKDWQGVFKTQSRLLSKLEALVIANHPDDTLQSPRAAHRGRFQKKSGLARRVRGHTT